MAYILRVYIIDPGDKMIKVAHEFYGYSQEEVDTYYKEHIASCEYFAAADREDRVIEVMEEGVPADELPRPADFEEEVD